MKNQTFSIGWPEFRVIRAEMP